MYGIEGYEPVEPLVKDPLLLVATMIGGWLILVAALILLVAVGEAFVRWTEQLDERYLMPIRRRREERKWQRRMMKECDKCTR